MRCTCVARNDRIARLLAVLLALARADRGVPLKLLAERNGWRLRSVYRDVEALEKAGIPIECNGSFYRVSRGFVLPGITA
jgi:predicted DNA-binding transcriptional regulator YafY